MPGFETAPRPKPEVEEKEEKGFKVVDKRVGPEALKQAEKELEKKRFNALTPEQREEWEYKRDKERGFTVKDRRRVTNINEYRAEPAPVEKAGPQTPVETQTPVESTPPAQEPPPQSQKVESEKVESTAGSLRAQAEQIRQEAAGLRIAVGGIRGEIEKTEEEIDFKYGGMRGKIITLESSTLDQKLLGLYTDLERKLAAWHKIEPNIFERELIEKQLKEAKKKISSLKTQSQPSPKTGGPWQAIKRFFGARVK